LGPVDRRVGQVGVDLRRVGPGAIRIAGVVIATAAAATREAANGDKEENGATQRKRRHGRRLLHSRATERTPFCNSEEPLVSSSTRGMDGRGCKCPDR